MDRVAAEGCTVLHTGGRPGAPGRPVAPSATEGMRADARAHGISEGEALQRAIDRIPLGRLAEPKDIAAMTVFAASPRASYLTGVVITMDGASVSIVI